MKETLDRISRELERLVDNQIQRAYEDGVKEGRKQAQKQLEGGVSFNAKLTWHEWEGLNIYVDDGDIEKDRKWVRKELNPTGEPKKGWEFYNRLFRVYILPQIEEVGFYKEK